MTPREEFRDYLFRFLHLPYRWGGSNPLIGMDCSGFAQLGLDFLLIDPPGDQTADGLYRHFRQHGTPVTVADLGVLLFFGAPRVTHVAFALDAMRMIEAGGGGSATVNLDMAAKQGAYIKVSRIARRSDLVAMLKPAGIPW